MRHAIAIHTPAKMRAKRWKDVLPKRFSGAMDFKSGVGGQVRSGSAILKIFNREAQEIWDK